MTTTLAFDPADIPYPTDLLELRFEVEGHATWDVDEDAPHLAVPIVYGRGDCPHCGHGTGRVEVPLVNEQPQPTVVYCQRMRHAPWPRPCGGPISLVPMLAEARHECPRCGGHDHDRLIVAVDGRTQLLRCRGCDQEFEAATGDGAGQEVMR